MNYNTVRVDINMREYGRHLQKLVDYAVNIENKDERQKVAESIVHLMGILNPQLKNVTDYKQKLWDHLFIISEFKINVESPYPIPTEDTYRIKPEKLPYPQNSIRMKHYGKNVEALVAKASSMEDIDKKEAFTEIIGNFMKMAYKNWSNEEVSNDLIKEDMKIISGGELKISDEMNIENMTRNQQKRRFSNHNNNNNNRNRSNNNNNNRNRNNNNNKNRNNNNRKRY
ncbi:MAG: DUF4290 domain-containing protein [Chitinophagales bacterium]|nr:DUF4290 domain-containing protein [Bacteroidota bacterium]